MGKRILLVESDDLMRQILSEQFSRQEDFLETGEAATGAEALEMARVGQYDVVLIDAALSDMDGREVCRRLREAGVRVPIVMLTSAEREQDAASVYDASVYDAGADDYVTKPFRLSVLLTRVRAHLRQHEHSDNTIFSIAHYTFQPSARTLMDEERKIRLTEKEAGILTYLLRAGNVVVGRDTLLHEVWGYSADVTTHTLETHIYRLRQKMEQDHSTAKILITEPGGYRLLA